MQDHQTFDFSGGTAVAAAVPSENRSLVERIDDGVPYVEYGFEKLTRFL